MTIYDDKEHPRGQADNAGQFRDKSNSGPEAALVPKETGRTPEEITELVAWQTWTAKGKPEHEKIVLSREAFKSYLTAALMTARKAQEEVDEARHESARAIARNIYGEDLGAPETAISSDDLLDALTGAVEAGMAEGRPAPAFKPEGEPAPAFKPEGEPDEYRDLWTGNMPRVSGYMYFSIPGEQPIRVNDDQARRFLETLSAEA